MENDSRQVMPLARAALTQPSIFPKQEIRVTMMTSPQVWPLLRRLTCVFNPEQAKNYLPTRIKKKVRESDVTQLKDFYIRAQFRTTLVRNRNLRWEGSRHQQDLQCAG